MSVRHRHVPQTCPTTARCGGPGCGCRYSSGRISPAERVLEWHVEGVTAPLAWRRIQNSNSPKVLGVAGMSTVNSANVVQYDDNGTSDHLWRLP
jgi:hypothetical protein